MERRDDDDTYTINWEFENLLASGFGYGMHNIQYVMLEQ
jgi:hypothetical protein